MAARDARARRPGHAVRVERLDDARWRLPREQRADMLVDGLVIASDELMAELQGDPALEQVTDVATLPGIVGASLAMPDIHWGYGFPIGGVAAFRRPDGVVSPGGIGFDINCGVRLLRSDLAEVDVHDELERLAEALFDAVPSGLGASGRRRLDAPALAAVLTEGAIWAVGAGHGWPEDLAMIEEGGRMVGDPTHVSERARQRGADQLGTLGSGNHFIELDVVDRVLDKSAAALGLSETQVVLLIHTGSRGLGHQVCTDHVAIMDRTMAGYGIRVPDRQLACAPLDSAEGRAYIAAMGAAANFAWANRQCIAQAAREAIASVLRTSARRLGLSLVYDVSHNIARLERHVVGGSEVEVCVHRKGATRALPPGHPGIAEPYRDVGQPVLIPGDMGRCSYVAVGTAQEPSESFASTCHGAGRRLSRHAAIRQTRDVDIAGQLAAAGVIVRAERPSLLGEEASLAYKDVSAVVAAAAKAGQIRPVARLRPVVVVKG